jgi:hypothetical protein
MILSASGSLAQTQEPAFPPGVWEGSVAFTGTFESSGQRSDGTSYDNATAVTSSALNFEMVVDDDGTIVSGAMQVNIVWAVATSGRAPVTGDSYMNGSDHRQSGKLQLQGTATQMEAAGLLAYDKQIYDTQGNLIEEISGVEEIEVLWTFQPFSADCSSVTGELVAAEGTSLMATALGPDIIFDDGYEAVNRLVSQFWAYPVFEDSDLIALAIGEVNEFAARLLEGVPEPELMVELVEAVEKIRADLARLEVCQDTIDGFSPSQTEDWLTNILRNLFTKVLEAPGEYTPQDLITMLSIGARGGALTGEVYTGFGEALGIALSNALAVDDIDSIFDIAVAAAQYGYQDVYEDAAAALDTEESGG